MKSIVKKYIPFIFLFNLILTTYATEKIKTDELADCKNYVIIKGSTNINKFEFTNEQPNVTHNTNAKKPEYSEQNILIPVKKFSGPNNMMLKDFQNMLDASEFPNIKIEIEPTALADFDETTGLTNFKTKISIAGNTHNYVIPCELADCENSGKIIKGYMELELSDFKIDPPKKVFGTVKVNDQVFITFAFHYK
jgi:hypothetical protein